MNNSVRWEITSNCNLNCRHCAVHEIKKEDITLDEAKRIVDRIASLGANEILFSTKEPFAYKYFWELLEYCTRMGIYAKILTNGTLLDEEAVRRLYKYKIKMVCVSLDGWTEEDNDSIRGKGTFKRIMNTLGWFHKYNTDTDYPYIQIFVQNCITEANIRNIEKIGELFADYPEMSISLSPIMLLGNAKTNKEIRADQEEILKYRNSMYSMVHKVKNDMFIRPRTYFDGIATIFKYNLNELPIKPTCSARDPEIFTILSDGKLCKCVMLLDSCVEFDGQLVFGNAVNEIGAITSEPIDDSLFKDNEVCKKCPIADECKLCLAVSLSKEALHEQLDECGEGMEEVDELLAGIRNGKYHVRLNDSIILYKGNVTVIGRTRETYHYSVSENVYAFMSKNFGAESIGPKATAVLSDEELRYLLSNNLIWEAR